MRYPTWLILGATLALEAGAIHRPTVVPTRLRVIGTTDFHGALEPRPDASGRLRGGAAAFATAIARARAECRPPECESILLDGGDQFQGTPASNLAYGRPVSELFNRLGLDAAALGNHEWDWGQDTLRARMAQQRYRVLGANVRYADGRRVPWIPADTIIVRGSARVGVIGITTRSTATSTKASNIQGLVFLDAAPIVDSLAVALRARGANVIVVVGHVGAMCQPTGTCGGEIIDMAQRLTQRVDAIVAGHSHALVNTVVNGIPIVEARATGQSIGVIDIPLEPRGVATREVRDVYTDSLPGDPEAARIASDAARAVAARVNRPVATIADDMRRQGFDYALGKLIADAMRAAGNADFAVMNQGGIRADLRKGPATYGDLFEISPFANYLYRVTARGADMKRYLELVVRGPRPRGWISGATITYDTTRADGDRITAIELAGGRAFSDTASYSVVINDFMLTGGNGFAFVNPAAKSEPLNVVDLDALVSWVESRPQPVVAPADVRLRVAPR